MPVVVPEGPSMPTIARAYYQSSFQDFLTACNEEILGQLSLGSEFSVGPSQRNAWIGEFDVLRQALAGLDGFILLEYQKLRSSSQPLQRW